MNDNTTAVRGQSVFGYVQSAIDSLTRQNRIGNAKKYGSFLNGLRRYRGGCDFTFQDLDEQLVKDYETWLLSGGNTINTSSAYLRVFRTIYYNAAKDGIVKRRQLFKGVYTGFPKTEKNAVDIDCLCRLRGLDLTRHKSMAFARDLFFLSFYMKGISFVDMAHLRKSDLKDGYVEYIPEKSHVATRIRWEREMQDIIDRYASKTRGLPYMLPVITRLDGTERLQYESSMRSVNRNLNRIGRMLGLSFPLTTNVARNTWDAMVRDMNLPLEVVRRSAAAVPEP